MLVLALGQVAKEADAPLPPREAAMRWTVPPGFRVTLFAGEPDVVQPIAFTLRRSRPALGRRMLFLSQLAPGPQGGQGPRPHLRGHRRRRRLRQAHGLLPTTAAICRASNYGFGGIWLCSTPQPALHSRSRTATTNPPARRKSCSTAGACKAQHNVFNSLNWGPDGWLYGCNGIIATSKVGKPGTPDKERVPINCGVWRYHPTKKKFEAVAQGTTNPWGLDFDEHGEMFITNCVIDHLWHVVPGAHFERMYGQDLNPHVYGLMPELCRPHPLGRRHTGPRSRGGKGECTARPAAAMPTSAA